MENVSESDELDEIKLLAYDDVLELEEGRDPPSLAVWGFQDTSVIGPLLHAAVNNLVDSVNDVLLMDDPSMDVNETDSFGRTALHLACWKGNDQIVMTLLKCPDINVNPRALGGVTPLHLAAYFGYDDVMSTLLTHPDIDLDVRTDEQQFSTAHFCLSRGHVKAFTMYLTKCYRSTRRTPDGSRFMLNVINAKDTKDRTPLHYAVWENRIQAVKLLLEFELIRVNTADKYGFTPLHLASFKGHEEIACLLLENKNSNPNVIVKRLDMEGTDLAMEREVYVDVLLIDSPDVRASIWNFFSSEIPLLVKDYYNILWQITLSQRDRQVYVDASNAILVGAALIASVTFAGWLQPPLGYTPSYVSEGAPMGTYENYASVEHLGTRVFWIFNSLSFFFAIATVLAGAGTLLPRKDKFIAVEVHIVRKNLVLTSILLVSSIVFVLGAFGAAGFVALPPIFRFEVNMIITSAIGVTLCVVMLCFFATRLYRLRYVPSWLEMVLESVFT